MFSRRTLPVLVGLVFLSGMFLVGQDTWEPPGPSITDIVPSEGYRGDEVTVRGSNFGTTQATSTVTFYEVDAGPALAWADETIVINVPIGAATGPVRVTVGGVASNGYPFTVWPACVVDADCDASQCPTSYCLAGYCNGMNPGGLPCDDGNPCTINTTCSHHGNCVIPGTFVPGCCLTDAACDDGNRCTDEACVDHACVYTIAEECLHIQRSLPDTGQDQCYDNSTAMECPPPGQPFHGQDAQYEIHPMSFAVDPDGLTVTDSVTGLVWQRGTYLSYWPGAAAYCDGLTLAGHGDWRLPNRQDLLSIIDYGRAWPAIDTESFLGDNQWTWSSSSSAADFNYVWVVAFMDGSVYSVMKDDGLIPRSVRCVRGENIPYNAFTDNLDGTVTDNQTGRTWQQDDDDVPRTWEDALAYCQNSALAGHADWRLPNVRELASIVNAFRYDPAIDTVHFTGAGSDYWSSSTPVSSVASAWVVVFSHGQLGARSKTGTSHVRCVR